MTSTPQEHEGLSQVAQNRECKKDCRLHNEWQSFPETVEALQSAFVHDLVI